MSDEEMDEYIRELTEDIFASIRPSEGDEDLDDDLAVIDEINTIEQHVIYSHHGISERYRQLCEDAYEIFYRLCVFFAYMKHNRDLQAEEAFADAYAFLDEGQTHCRQNYDKPLGDIFADYLADCFNRDIALLLERHMQP